MKLTTLIAVMIAAGLVSSAQAAEQPATPLKPARCKAAWEMASPNGETLSRGKASPYVLNFAMVDTNHNGAISAREFKRGCKAGWVTAADASTIKNMKQK
jgi:hypothetical protein